MKVRDKEDKKKKPPLVVPHEQERLLYKLPFY